MEESEPPVMSQDAEAVGQELATDDGIETRIDTSTVTDTSLDETIMESSITEAEEQTMDDSGSTSQNVVKVVKKRRGRPPKAQQSTAVEAEQVEEQAMDDSGDFSESMIAVVKKRRRSKPPKNRESTAVLESSTEQAEEQSMDDSGTVAKRKRGRPSLKSSSSAAKRKSVASNTNSRAKTGKTKDVQLYDIVQEGKSALQSVVSEWMERYQGDAETGMLELVQFFVHCSGCKAVITRRMFETQEASSVIRSLTENFAEESVEYPLISSGANAKKFKANFSEFIERLVSQCQHNIIYDEYMLDTLVMWLVGLTDSQVRAFRHTCTLACLKLNTAIIHVATDVSTELDNTQRQVDSERRRSSSQQVSGKLQRLNDKLTRLKKNLNELQGVLAAVFSSVFVHRYRDTRPEIRALCIAELGVWLRQYSIHYLNDQYLKYIGWTLNDKSSEVRAQSVISLQPLYSSIELFPHLELFTQKFKDRLVIMRLDKDDNVSVSAVALCSHLLDLQVLEEEDCLEICELVFTDNRSLAQEAGAFTVKYLFSDAFMRKARQQKPICGRKKPTDAQIMLKEIVNFFVDAGVHQHAVYLVDSLWEHAGVLRDWGTMMDMLLDESCAVELTAQQEKGLIEIMTCSVKRAGGVVPKGKSKARDRRAIEQDREAIASKLIPCLPDLITKYGVEADNAVNLASIPQLFDLEMYVELRAEKHLENLAIHLRDLIMKHTVTEVLVECGLTFHHLLDTDFSLHSTVSVQFSELVEELLSSCTSLMGMLKETGMVEENEDVCNLSVTLKRIADLSKTVDLTSWQFADHMLALADAAVDANCCEMLSVPAFSFLRTYLLWLLKAVNNDEPDREELRVLHGLTRRVMTQYIEALQFSSSVVLQHEAFSALCDLLIAFSSQLHNHGVLGSLVYTPDASLPTAMCDYVMQNVIGEEEEEEPMEEPVPQDQMLSRVESLNDKRILLAGFLKLVIYGVFEIPVAAPVFRCYLKNFLNYGDLIKYSITTLREADPVNWCKAILLSLQQLYVLSLDDQGFYESSDWADAKDLAHRYVLTLGFDYSKYRRPLISIHREGIKYALLSKGEDLGSETPPPHLSFLDILSEFSIRLYLVDRVGTDEFKGMLQYLMDQLGEGVLEETEGMEGWEPLHRYVASLKREESQTAANIGGRKKPGKRKVPGEEDQRQGGQSTK